MKVTSWICYFIFFFFIFLLVLHGVDMVNKRVQLTLYLTSC